MAETPEEMLEEAKKSIGRETATAEGRYPVEYDPIRRYCHMTDDDNPLFLDPGYARKGKHGAVVCPPLLADYFAGRSALPPVQTPGDRNINLTTEYEFFKPVKVGDRLSSKSRITAIYIKAIRLDSKAFWTETERTITNQDDEVVMVSRNIGLRHRTPEQIEEAGDA